MSLDLGSCFDELVALVCGKILPNCESWLGLVWVQDKVMLTLYERAMKWIVDALDTWLSFTQPQAREEVEKGGFLPDHADRYCPCCGSSVGRGEVHVLSGHLGCAACHERVSAVDRVIRLGPYTEPLQSWILQIKFRRWELLGKELGHRLGKQVRDRYGQQVQTMVVVPVPMSPWRHLVRGIDHTRILSKAVAQELGSPLERPLSVQWRKPRSCQARLSQSSRRKLPQSRWRLSRRLAGKLRNRHILLVDDVRTTGRTLNTAAGVLMAAQPQSISAAVIAGCDKSRQPLNDLNFQLGEPWRGMVRTDQVAHISCLG